MSSNEQKIMYWVPTGERHIKWREDGTWTIKPMWRRRVVVSFTVAPISWSSRNVSHIRFWVGRECVLHWLDCWQECPEEYLKEFLKENGFHLRWWDKLKDTGTGHGIRDVYIQSTILEKLYER